MTKYDRIQNAAHWMQYHAQLVNKSKKTFTPCNRACKMIELGRTELKMIEIENQVVYQEHCHCHLELTVEILQGYEFDDRAKKAHYYHKLVPAY